KVHDSTMKFDITEHSLKTDTVATAPPCPAPGKVIGDAEHPSFGCFDIGTLDPFAKKDQPCSNDAPPFCVNIDGTGIPCFFGTVCEVALAVVDFVVDKLSFGAIDLDLAFPDIVINTDIAGKLGAAHPDPIGLNKIKVDEQKIKDHNQS